MADYPYRTYSSYLKERFGGPVKKISLHAGFNCPNRDGNISRTGCIFCEPQSYSPQSHAEPLPLIHQLRAGVEKGKKRGIGTFIAYFQSYSNTYGPLQVLKDTYDTIRAFPEIKGLSIGTRPDCVERPVLELINSYTGSYEVWIEYGLQSIHDRTLTAINRGHDSQAFYRAVELTRAYEKIKCCAHVILGLPDETMQMETATAKALEDMAIDGVKIHPLHVVKNTLLAAMYEQGKLLLLSEAEYIERVINFLAYLPSPAVIQRLTADCPENVLLAPDWLNNKNEFLQALVREMQMKKIYQGCLAASK